MQLKEGSLPTKYMAEKSHVTGKPARKPPVNIKLKVVYIKSCNYCGVMLFLLFALPWQWVSR